MLSKQLSDEIQRHLHDYTQSPVHKMARKTTPVLGQYEDVDPRDAQIDELERKIQRLEDVGRERNRKIIGCAVTFAVTIFLYYGCWKLGMSDFFNIILCCFLFPPVCLERS